MTFSSCQKREEIPQELIYSFEYLNENWDKKEINKFRSISENDTTPRDYHFGIGMHIRNNLLRHNPKSDSIVKFFNDLEISHFDYMSGIILTSYHRHLNEKDINLKEQVNGIIEMLKPTVDCQNRRKKKAKELYNSFKVIDTISVQMPVSTFSNNKSVISYNCPNDSWHFDNAKDLLIDGIITEKYIRKDSFSDNPNEIYEEYNFKLKILKMNNPDIHYFTTEVTTGDEIELPLDYSYNVE